MAKKERILVVDDDPSIQETVTEMVSRMGCDFATANHGKEALEILKKDVFTILLADLQMPEMDGLELTRLAHAEFPTLTILCMTNREDQGTLSDGITSGATDFILKPFTFDELKVRLNRVMKERNQGEEVTQKVVELEIANEELRRLDQLKTGFVSNVSDELQTPMTVIKEFVSLMLKGQVGSLTEEQREYLGIANRNILRLTNLIEKLLDFSRIEAGKGLKLRFKPTRLSEVIEDSILALSQQADEKKITLETRLDADTPLVLIDRTRLMEVFVNLIGNGIKFTPPGGKVTVDSKGLTEDRGALKIVVSDTGVGIAEEDLPRIFERFYQGKRTPEGDIKGTGLGLSISKEIVDGHRGVIQAEGREGGASFVFTLPLYGVNAIFDLMIQPMIEEAERDSMPLSVIQVEFWNQQTKREAIFASEAWEGLVGAVHNMVRSVDTVVPFHQNRVYVLTFNEKKLAKEIGKRVQGKLLYGNYLPKKTDVQFKTFTHPQEAPTREDFLKGCRQLLKED
jgi:signal transduction histidine kinase